MIPSSRSDFSIPSLNQEKVLAALGNRLRWRMFRMLATGTPMNSAAVAREFKRDFDGISKHLRILRSAGLLRSRPASDRRVADYYIPAEFRQNPGEIELGFCLLRVPEARPDPVEESAAVPEASTVGDSMEPDLPVRGFGEMLVDSAAMGSGREG